MAIGDDRALLTSVLQSMSDKVANRGGGEMVPTDAFAAQPADIPDDPMDPEALEEDHVHPEDAGKPSTSSYAWGGHQNGRIPAKALKALGQGSHRLEAAAADAWVAMRAAAAAEGISLSLTDSYRSYDAQVAVRKKKGHQVATATPGTSVHGWGKAVDANVNDPKTLAWLRANGERFGWVNPAWAQRKGKSWEPWHWEYAG